MRRFQVFQNGFLVELGAGARRGRRRYRLASELDGLVGDSGTVKIGGACPGFEDCQGFVPPCENCNDIAAWREIAQERLDGCFASGGKCGRIRIVIGT